MRAASPSCGDNPAMPRWVAISSGKNAARATNTVLAPSPRPNHAVSSGTQANSATWRTAVRLGPSTRSARCERPSKRPTNKPAPPPSTRPVKVRCRLSSNASGSVPSASPLNRVRSTPSGEVRMFGSTQPRLLEACHSASSAIGSNRLCQPFARGPRCCSPVAGWGQNSRRFSRREKPCSINAPTRPITRMHSNTRSSMNNCRPHTIR
ncbi:hypothetical protein D3C79_777370 [compost metagenome]